MRDEWREEYRLRARLPAFRRLVDSTRELIARQLDRADVRWYAAVSFGKDSITMLDLLLEQRPDITVLHMDSGYCLPELYETREWFVRERGIRLEVKKGVDYMELMKEFGLPHISRTQAQQQRIVQRLKKSPGEEWATEHGFNGIFLGLRMEESRGRLLSLRLRSPVYRMRSGLWKCCPLAYWNAKDVWAYIVSRELPYPRFYDFTALGEDRLWIRSQSWVTTDGAPHGRIVWLKYYYPELYTRLVKEFPIISHYF